MNIDAKYLFMLLSSKTHLHITRVINRMTKWYFLQECNISCLATKRVHLDHQFKYLKAEKPYDLIDN